MNLLSFMRQKAIEKGMKNCPSCGKEDIFFALNGKCLECDKPIQRNNAEKTLQFSIEIIAEFLDKYDEIFTSEEKKTPIQFLKGLIYTLSTKNTLENEKIIRLQSFIKNIKQIGGNVIGGAITMENGRPNIKLLKDFKNSGEDPYARVKSLSVVVLSIQYILGYEVRNEYVLETESTAILSKTITNKSSKSKGCLGSLILIFTTLTFILGLYIIIL